MITVDQEYTQEVECVYRGETYKVRDNGAIMRLPLDGKIRPTDNKWTFGRKDANSGYLFFTSKVRVHQVVATAYHGEPKAPNMVVDHIDTNRCNNRPENLRWLTKLENILNNELTRAKVKLICGSIEAFLKNPSLLFNHENDDKNFSWMRSVSKEEARISLENMKYWYKDNDKPSTNTGIGEWVFQEHILYSTDSKYNTKTIHSQDKTQEENTSTSDELTWDIIEKALGGEKAPTYIPEKDYFAEQKYEMPSTEVENIPHYKASLTPGAAQLINWRTPTEFPLCPDPTKGKSIQDYFELLEKGEIITKNEYGFSTIEEAAWSENGKIIVKCKMPESSMTPWSIMYIFMEDGLFIHGTDRTYHTIEGANKYFTLYQGKEWTGGDVLEDYC